MVSGNTNPIFWEADKPFFPEKIFSASPFTALPNCMAGQRHISDLQPSHTYLPTFLEKLDDYTDNGH